MVDAHAPNNLRFESDLRGPAAATAHSAGSQRTFQCLSGADALGAYRAFCRDACFAPPQDPRWVESWASNCNPEILVMISEAATGGVALALEVVDRGPLRIACFPGGSHANGNFPAILSAVPQGTGGLLREGIRRELRNARPDIDLVLFERLAPTFEEYDNPFAELKSWASPNPALAVDLTGGFDAVLERASGKRKRKKHRAQTRKFAAAGGFRRIRASNRSESDRLLDAFFAMKAVRFQANGIQDVFADERVRTFFRDLFGKASASSSAPDFVLHGLEVGGTLRAVTGCSATRSSMICEFGSIAEDDLASASPGDFLFFENIKEACEAGLRVYDFSVGDENYKRLWCDLETWHFDVAIPLSMKGRVAAGCLRTLTSAKGIAKSNPLARKLLRSLRRRARSSASG